ncbi:alpha/beta fold hydrolase [Thalassobaculum sp. OXR-137]|uniref:alpha/beta family hydrolase n=1 Tax=Thalassobaculum sp. OXR-137 TaxID=3100173 RepID=UPI002AC9D505|nr:alpha/beta family hydrolase [Thalassobaculum sp. OXR-137]WPZ34660.1 alpha/beta fold hydrolase [Thalassobaculum sp. OXR-137]
MSDTPFLTDGPAEAAVTLVLAHGAGAPMDSPFMSAIAERIAARGHRVVRFEFDYMAERRTTGHRRPPERAPALLEQWRGVIDRLGGPDAVAIGGKSMGGRMASLVAAETAVRGCLCLGYPFHPPGKPERLRTEHLARLRCPTLIVQGSRDPFGTKEEVAAMGLPDGLEIEWIEDGNHDLAPRKASGWSVEQAWDRAADMTDRFLRTL